MYIGRLVIALVINLLQCINFRNRSLSFVKV